MRKTDRISDLCERAKKVALNSTMEQQHGCLVIKDGKVVAEGFNQIIEAWSHQYSIHAEVDALSKLKHKDKHYLSQCEMIVVRIGPKCLDNAFKLSMPCEDCRRLIESACVKRVYYSTNDDFDEAIQLHDDCKVYYENICNFREMDTGRRNKRRYKTDASKSVK